MASERNNNAVPSLQVKSNAADSADVILWADPTTHRLLVDATLTGGGTSMVDDAAFTPAVSSINPIGAFFDDAAPDSVNEGDGGVVRMSANRNLYVTIRDAAGNERGLNIDASGQLAITVASIPSHAVTNAGTFAVQENGAALTALQLIDDTVATLGTSTYTEATTKGLVIAAVRRDADTTLVDTTNEIGPLQMNANGQLKVEVFSGETLPVSLASVPSHPVTNAGTFPVQVDGAALTSLQLIDDIIKTDDAAFTPATDKVAMVGAQFDDTTPDSVDEGDAGALRMSGRRELYVQLRDAAGNERGLNIDASGQIAITLAAGQTLGTVTTVTTVSTVTAVTNVATIGTSVTPGTSAAHLGKAEDAVHGSGDTGVFSLGVANEAQSSLAADGDYIAQATDTKGNRLIVGNLAHDAVDAGFPVKVGGQARTTNPTAVADADRANFITDKLGKQVVVGSIRDLKVNQVTTITASTSETTILTAVASTFLDLYGLIIANTSATAVNVAIKDDTAGTTQLNIAVPAGETRGFMLPESAAIKQGAVNKNWTATSSASISSLVITALAVKNI